MSAGEVSVESVKVLGTGCANCKATVKLIEEVARAKGAPVTVEKVEEIRDIMSYGVMSTPGVVIDGTVVHAGGIPARAKVESWFDGALVAVQTLTPLGRAPSAK